MTRIALILLSCAVFVAPLRAQTKPERQATVRYLQGLQQPDGGFVPAAPRPGETAASSLRATSGAVRALKYFGGAPKDPAACADFVARCFDPAKGSFADAPAGEPNVFTTAVGGMAVVALKMPAAKYRDGVIAYLAANASDFEAIRIAAAGCEAFEVQPTVAPAWRAKLTKMANADGSFGSGDSAARDTGGAVAALLRLGGKVENRDRVLAVLRAGQRADGGFGKTGVATSDPETTYRVMRTFHMLRASPERPADVRAYFAGLRNPDGGYALAKGQPSSVGATYYAGSVLHWLDGEK